MSWTYTVKMEDGSVWECDAMEIARNRATYYADEYGDDVERALREDSMNSDHSELVEWAQNNMNAEDAPTWKMAKGPDAVTPQDAWLCDSESREIRGVMPQ